MSVVVVSHAARHPEQADPMPWQRENHDADEPEPELNPHQRSRKRRATRKLRPQVVSDHEVHDHDRAGEYQMEMTGHPLRVMDALVELVAHVDNAARATETEHDEGECDRKHERLVPRQRLDPSQRTAPAS